MQRELQRFGQFADLAVAVLRVVDIAQDPETKLVAIEIRASQLGLDPLEPCVLRALGRRGQPNVPEW